MVPRPVPDLPEGPVTHPGPRRWSHDTSCTSRGFSDPSRSSPRVPRPIPDHPEGPPTCPGLPKCPPTRPKPPRGSPDPSWTSPRVPEPSWASLRILRLVLDLPEGPLTLSRKSGWFSRPVPDFSEGPTPVPDLREGPSTSPDIRVSPPTHPGSPRGSPDPSRNYSRVTRPV